MVNDLLNASFHVLLLNFVSILCPITAMLVLLDSFTCVCGNAEATERPEASKLHYILTSSATVRQNEKDELDKV